MAREKPRKIAQGPPLFQAEASVSRQKVEALPDPRLSALILGAQQPRPTATQPLVPERVVLMGAVAATKDCRANVPSSDSCNCFTAWQTVSGEAEPPKPLVQSLLTTDSGGAPDILRAVLLRS